MILVTWTEEDVCDWNTFYDKKSKECKDTLEANNLVEQLKKLYYVSDIKVWKNDSRSSKSIK